MKTDIFQSCIHCWVFQICWHIECSTFTASSFRIWNSSTGISSPPLALIIVILSKAYLTSHSRMSGSRWVITPSWLSGSWRSFLYSSSVFSCHLFLISSAYVRSIPFLSFIKAILAWNIRLVSLIFIKKSIIIFLFFPLVCSFLFIHSYFHEGYYLNVNKNLLHRCFWFNLWVFKNFKQIFCVQFSSVAQKCLTLCDAMNWSMPGLSDHHQFREFTQTHVHWVSDAIQPSHPLSAPFFLAFNLCQHQGLFQWVSSSHQVAKVLEFQLQYQSFKWTLRTGFL